MAAAIQRRASTAETTARPPGRAGVTTNTTAAAVKTQMRMRRRGRSTAERGGTTASTTTTLVIMRMMLTGTTAITSDVARSAALPAHDRRGPAVYCQVTFPIALEALLTLSALDNEWERGGTPFFIASTLLLVGRWRPHTILSERLLRGGLIQKGDKRDALLHIHKNIVKVSAVPKQPPHPLLAQRVFRQVFHDESGLTRGG